jgi:hypothetical protein
MGLYIDEKLLVSVDPNLRGQHAYVPEPHVGVPHSAKIGSTEYLNPLRSLSHANKKFSLLRGFYICFIGCPIGAHCPGAISVNNWHLNNGALVMESQSIISRITAGGAIG